MTFKVIRTLQWRQVTICQASYSNCGVGCIAAPARWTCQSCKADLISGDKCRGWPGEHCRDSKSLLSPGYVLQTRNPGYGEFTTIFHPRGSC